MTPTGKSTKVYFKSSDFNIIEEKANKLGLSVSVYVRALALKSLREGKDLI
jgi:hypothetical protein